MYKVTNPTNFFDAIEHLINNEVAPRLNQQYFKVQMTESEDKYTVKAELPGVDKKDIAVEFTKDNYMVVSVDATQRNKFENERVLHNEFKSYKASRQFYFQDNVDKDNVKASYDNGLLIVHVPKLKSQPTSNRIVIE